MVVKLSEATADIIGVHSKKVSSSSSSLMTLQSQNDLRLSEPNGLKVIRTKNVPQRAGFILTALTTHVKPRSRFWTIGASLQPMAFLRQLCGETQT